MLLSPSALHAFKWSMLSEAASRLIAPLTFLLLALILTPEDFGVVAAATVVISLSLAIAEAGLGKALVQRQGEIEPAASTAYWITVSFGLSATVALSLLAPYIAAFFRDTRVAEVIRVLSLQCVLASLCTVPAALLQRRLAFRELFWVRLSTTALPSLASIPLALTGMGYWALIAGTLAGHALQVIALWRASHWMPRLRLAVQVGASLLRFGRWAALSTLLAWFFMWADMLLVGHYLGAREMGLYRVGNALVVAVLGIVLAPLLPVLYTLFSQHQNDVPAIRANLNSVIRVIACVSLPGAALLLLASPLVEALLAPRGWSGIGSVIAFLGAAHGIAWLVGANGEALRGAGKAHAESLAIGLSIFGYLAVYLVAIRYGLQAFLIARLGAACVGVLVHVYVAHAALRFSVWSIIGGIRRPMLVAIAIAVLHFMSIRHDGTTVWVNSSLFMALGIAMYCLYLWTTERKLLRTVVGVSRAHRPPNLEERP